VNSSLGSVLASEPYVEAGRAAAYLSTSRKTLLKKARAGGLPAHPIGAGRKKMWRFRISELDHWMQTEVTSGSDGGRSKERKPFL
jgi:excisionase family DNA binding protein